MNVLDLVKRKLGVETTSHTNRLVTQVQNTITKIMNNDPGRLGFVLVNLSANDLHFGPFPDVSSTKGIFVAANGGSAKVEYNEDYTLPTMDWYAIAGGINSSILLLEIVIERGAS